MVLTMVCLHLLTPNLSRANKTPWDFSAAEELFSTNFQEVTRFLAGSAGILHFLNRLQNAFECNRPKGNNYI